MRQITIDEKTAEDYQLMYFSDTKNYYLCKDDNNYILNGFPKQGDIIETEETKPDNIREEVELIIDVDFSKRYTNYEKRN